MSVNRLVVEENAHYIFQSFWYQVMSVETPTRSEETGNGWEVDEDEWAPIDNYGDSVGQNNPISTSLSNVSISERVSSRCLPFS